MYSTHQKPPDFMLANIANLTLISVGGHIGKKVTGVTFVRCPTVLLSILLKLQQPFEVTAYG